MVTPTSARAALGQVRRPPLPHRRPGRPVGTSELTRGGAPAGGRGPGGGRAGLVSGPRARREGCPTCLRAGAPGEGRPTCLRAHAPRERRPACLRAQAPRERRPPGQPSGGRGPAPPRGAPPPRGGEPACERRALHAPACAGRSSAGRGGLWRRCRRGGSGRCGCGRCGCGAVACVAGAGGPRDRAVAVMAFPVVAGRIVAIDALSDPERLARLDVVALSALLHQFPR